MRSRIPASARYEPFYKQGGLSCFSRLEKRMRRTIRLVGSWRFPAAGKSEKGVKEEGRQIVFQHFAEQPGGFRDMELHTFDCYSQRGGDFLMRLVFVTAHREGAACLFRQFLQRFIYQPLYVGREDFRRLEVLECGYPGRDFP